MSDPLDATSRSSASRLLSLDAPVAIAHRGGSLLRPENTLAAFEYAWTLGVDAIECDVHLSQDGEVVVIHDDTLDRTTNGTGAVGAHTADALGALDAGYRFGETDGFPFRGGGIGVPRLSAVLERLAPLPLIVEIKGDRSDVVPPLVDLIRRAGASRRVIIGGFSQDVLSVVRRLAPDLPTSASRGEVRSALRRAYFRMPPRSAAYAVFQVPVRHAGRRVVSQTFVRMARRANRPVQAWVVDDPAEMTELLSWGVTGLISDRPDIAVRTVAAHRRRPTAV